MPLSPLSPSSHTCASALLWSSRVRHVMFSGATSGAYSFRMSALVLAGLATTSTWKGEEGAGGMCARACGRGCVNRGGEEVHGGWSMQHVGPRLRQVGWRHAHLDILGCVLGEGRGLIAVDGHVLGHHVLALHPGLAGEAADL